MKRKTAKLAAAMLLASQIAVTAAPVQAAQDRVEVKLPGFPVQINGVAIDSKRATYPLLVYKDITYFPMTWDYTESLGMSIQWNEKEGLSIDSLYVMQKKPSPELSTGNKAASYTAKLVNYPVKINGKEIDNATEPYPLLSFRDITYFPMTWRFMNNEFHMKLSWSAADGLGIISQQRHYFSSIFADDADVLYVNSGSKRFKLDKTLTRLPELLDGEEEAKVNAIAEARYKQEESMLPEVQFALADPSMIERKGNTFYYKGEPLLTLAEGEAGEQQAGFTLDGSQGKEYIGQVLSLDDDAFIVSLTESNGVSFSNPYGVGMNYRYFYIHGDQIHPIQGFAGWPMTRVQANEDGSYWLASRAYTSDSIHGRDVHQTGELVLLRPDGSSVFLNKHLNVREIEVLSRQKDGSLLFRAYSRIPSWGEESNPAYGIYRVDTSGSLDKLSDLHGSAYVSSDGDVWVADREINRIENVTKQQSKLWYDYELGFLGQ